MHRHTVRIAARPKALMIDWPEPKLWLHEDAPHAVKPSLLVAWVEKRVYWQNQGRVRIIPQAVIVDVLSAYRIWNKQSALDPRSSPPSDWNVIHWWQCTPLKRPQPFCQPRPRA